MTVRPGLLLAALLSACGSGAATTGGDAAIGDADAAVVCMPGNGAVPLPRGDAVGGVDPGTGSLWVFGGDVGTTQNCMPISEYAADVWRYDPDCLSWTQVTTTGAPGPRSRAAAAVDPGRRQLLVFGGRVRNESTGRLVLYSEVWALSFASASWTRLDMGGGPSARANSAAAYDPVADELLVFGGNTSRDALNPTPVADTWALSLTARTWRRVATTGDAPEPRLFHAMALQGRTLYVFGGGTASAFTGPFLDDLSALDLASGTWRALAAGGDETLGRINAGLVAVPGTDQLVLLGGHDDGRLGNRNDVFRIDADGSRTLLVEGDVFHRAGAGVCDFPADFVLADTASPERRNAFVTGIDTARGRALVFGGKTDCGSANDVWAVDLGTGAWRALRTTNDGVSCGHAGRMGCGSLCN